ncbi:MAG TPA: glycosyltransferase family 2 protein [Nitrospira sp.]|jgi:glycosyltransferase involved in cell wall biosynthesis|nr:glycosyltransferase family 2 protein [Nitrospira sp.]
MDQDRTERERPLVTVVTPSFNQGRFIRETIESVLSQDYPNLEYLVIDGGSTDETQEVLKAYGSRLCWVAEKDEGQADAVNKGLRKAKGEIFGWLNSDDTYLPGTISKIVQFFQAFPSVALVYGQAKYVDAEGRVVGWHPVEEFDYKRLAETCFISQPAVFFRREVFEEVGPLDICLHYAIDYEYWMRAGKKFTLRYMPELLATMRFHGEAKTVARRQEAQEEVILAIRRHYSAVPARTIYVYTYIRLLEKLMPYAQGVYPNGWATRYVTFYFSGKNMSARHIVIEGYHQRPPALTLRLSTDEEPLHMKIEPGEFRFRHPIPAAGQLQIDAIEEIHGREPAELSMDPLPANERPISYTLRRGCFYTIRNISIVDDAGRVVKLFTPWVTFLFLLTLPVFIIRNTFIINRHLSVRDQLATVVHILRTLQLGRQNKAHAKTA